MVTGRCIYRKTNNVPWDKFIDPTQMDPEDPLYRVWNAVHSDMVGEGTEKFPGMTSEFNVISPQELVVEYTFVSVEQGQQWLDNLNAFELWPATNWASFVDMMFGEDVIDEVIIDV